MKTNYDFYEQLFSLIFQTITAIELYFCNFNSNIVAANEASGCQQVKYFFYNTRVFHCLLLVLQI